MCKKLLAGLLSLVLVVSSAGLDVMAADTADGTGGEVYTVTEDVTADEEAPVDGKEDVTADEADGPEAGEDDGQAEDPETAVEADETKSEGQFQGVDGGNVSISPNGKPKVVIFFNTTCYNSQFVLKNLAQEKLASDIEYVAGEKMSAISSMTVAVLHR